MEKMPLVRAAQDDAVRRILRSEYLHLDNDDGTYYVVVGDVIHENNMNKECTATPIDAYSPEWNKVIQLLDKGEADLSQQIGLKLV